MTPLPWIVQLVLGVVVATAALSDVRGRRIPNWLVLCGLVAGIALNGFLYELAGLKSSLLGIGLAFLIYLPLYALRAMGAGDVKLMAALGALAGPADWFGIFMLTAVVGGIWAMVLIVSKGRLQKTLANVATIFRQAAALRVPYAGDAELDVRHPAAITLPHAVSIAFGSFLFLLLSAVWIPR